MISDLLKDKHVIIAMIVAPILAVLSYFATDFLVSEKPHKAVEGGVYTLRVNSNCRWESGNCKLDNSQLEIIISGRLKSSRDLIITLKSNTPLDGAKLAFNRNGNESPIELINSDDAYLNWQGVFNASASTPAMNVAISANKSTFFAQIPSIFLNERKKDMPIIR